MAVNRNRVLKAADKYTRQGKLDAAIEELLKLVKDNPKDMTTVNRVGDLYARLGKSREAVAQFKKIADHYQEQGFLLKSIAIYKKITKLAPTDMRAFESLARLYSHQGLTMEARSQYQTVVDHHQKQGASDAALGALQEMLEIDPDDLKVRLSVAELLERTGKLEEALHSYRRVGADLDRRGMFAESRKVYEAALRIAPGEIGLLRRLLVSLRRQQKSAEAVQYLGGLLEASPADVDLMSLVGDAHLDAGDADQAREIYGLVRQQAPDRAENHLNEARVLLKDGEPDVCFQHLEGAASALGGDRVDLLIPYYLELLDERPHHIGGLRRLVELHQAAGHDVLARDACIRLAGACMEQGRLEDAAAALERLITMDPENPRHPERLQDVLARMTREGRTYPPAPPAEAPPQRAEAAVASQASARTSPPPPGPPPEPPVIVDEPGVEVPADIEVALPPAEPEIDSDFVAEHMTEAEVFVKYGLVDRAMEQLQQVVERYPGHLPARQALVGIHREEGDRPRAAAQYREIARILQARGDVEGAAQALREAEEFHPGGSADDDAVAAVGAPDDAMAVADDVEEPAELRSEPLAAGAAPGSDTPAAPRDLVEEFEEVEEAEEAEIDLDLAPAVPLPAERLEEIDMLIEGGALEEARRRLGRLRTEFPGRSEVEERLNRVGLLEASARPAPESPSPEASAASGSTDFFDLAAELDESLFEPQMAVEEKEPEAEGHSLEDLVEAFKKGVEQEVDPDDYETHYNLAIAYKEMGLVDEAIGEFQFAAKSPQFFLKCCSMLGLCFRDKGMNALAEKWYMKGLANPAGEEEELLGLRYDLALLHQESGEAAKALEIFTEIYGVNAKYRDVRERMNQLRESASG